MNSKRNGNLAFILVTAVHFAETEMSLPSEHPLPQNCVLSCSGNTIALVRRTPPTKKRPRE